MLSYTLTNISSESEDFTQTLIDAGVDPSLANVLTDINAVNFFLSNEETYEAIINVVDADGDGTIDIDEIVAALPGPALAAAGAGGPAMGGS